MLIEQRYRVLRGEAPVESFYDAVTEVKLERHPFSPSALKGTPAERFDHGQDRLGWVAYDRWGNPVGVNEADAWSCPYATLGEWREIDGCEFGADVVSIGLLWEEQSAGVANAGWIWVVQSETRAPVMKGKLPRGNRGVARAGTISWAEHLEVFERYVAARPARLTGVTAEGIAGAGGFAKDEAVALLGRKLKTWRPL